MQGTGRVPPTATLWPAHEGDLLDALVADAWERLVVIDAAEIGSAPGSWTRLEGTQALARSASSGSHRLSLIDALGVAHALGKNPEAVCVFAIQPGSTDWSPGLSQPVAEAVETLSNTVLEMLGAGG
jgi:hydrogenase maturation protease